MAKQQLQALHHCVFSLHFHLVIVTKYRRKVISNEMKKRLGEIFSNTLRKWECELIEFNGEADHVHLLFSATPKPSLSALVNNLKTVSSRLIRKEFRREISKVYWKPVFWHRSYCLITCGGAPLTVIQQYIQQQGKSERRRISTQP
jgi:putative transposase